MTVIRICVAALLVLGVISSFCFGDPVGLLQPSAMFKKQTNMEFPIKVSEADKLEFALETLRQMDSSYDNVSHLELAKRFESPNRKMIREIEKLRNGESILDDFRPREVDFVFEFEKVYQSNPYLEALDLELYALDLQSAKEEGIRRLAAYDLPPTTTSDPEKNTAFRQVSFPKKKNGDSEPDEDSTSSSEEQH